jgi:hypothetical protein
MDYWGSQWGSSNSYFLLPLWFFVKIHRLLVWKNAK